MENNQQSPKAYFRMLGIIHLGLVLGVFIFGLVVTFFIADFQHPDTESELANLLIYLVPGLVMAGIIASNVVFKIKLNGLKEINELNARMKGYSEPLIIRYMLLEFPALFTLVAVFLTNTMTYLVYAGLIIVLLGIKRPTLKSAITELELDQQEIAFLENPDSVIV